MIPRNKIKAKVIEFVDTIELLSQSCVYDKEKLYIGHEVKEARYLIGYNEWFIAFENLTTNLYEISYKMDQALIDSAKDIFLQADPSQSAETLLWLDELRKES